jgi:Zn-dependent M16 (insulinase) family peptidase
MYRVLIFFLAVAALSQQRQISYSGLTEGQTVSGFRTTAVYLDDAGQAIGARFRHERTGFTLDLLEIQSVPQSYIWVTTYPTSNMGEAHTQEHLLVGKGSKGRALGSKEAMSLVTSGAFTRQWTTCYNFYVSAGPEVFYQFFESTLDALLHPDYSDEEIRREVRNFGVSADPKTGVLRLE